MKGVQLATMGDPPAFSALLRTMQAGRFNTAEDVANSLIARYPDHAEAMYHRAIIAAYRDNDWAGAAELMAYVSGLRPEWPEAAYNAGFFTHRRGVDYLGVARVFYEKALQLEPGMPAALTNLGTLALGRGEHAEAIRLLTEASGQKASEPLARYNRAMAYLLLGQWEQGWEDYEQRLQWAPFRKGLSNLPMWDGEQLHGKHLLVESDQGLGDVLMVSRWMVELAEFTGARTVTWRVQRPLVPLLNAIEPGIAVPDDEPIPAGMDCQVPAMSLPYWMGARPDGKLWKGHAYATPSLPSPARAHDWGGDGSVQIVTPPNGPIGLCWAGSPTHENDVYRSLPVGFVQDLMARCPADTPWRSFQMGPRAAEAGLPVPAFADFGATADALFACRLLITVDTAVAHLAGMYGVPCWLLLSGLPDFRWLLDRRDTPWYPSVRLYRQAAVGSWTDVFDQVAADLAKEYPHG